MHLSHVRLALCMSVEIQSFINTGSLKKKILFHPNCCAVQRFLSFSCSSNTRFVYSATAYMVRLQTFKCAVIFSRGGFMLLHFWHYANVHSLSWPSVHTDRMWARHELTFCSSTVKAWRDIYRTT